MATLADPSWVEYWIERDEIHILDPRSPREYEEAHFPGAVNLPLERLIDKRGATLPDEEIAAILGEAGLDRSKRALTYDDADGGRGAFLAWLLEYLGRGEVALCGILFSEWQARGFPVSREPNTLPQCEFITDINPRKRVTLSQLRTQPTPVVFDLRSPQESVAAPLPGVDAVSLPWTELLGDDGSLLRPDAGLMTLLKRLKVARSQPLVTHSTTGLRAAIGYLALKRAGYDARVLDSVCLTSAPGASG